MIGCYNKSVILTYAGGAISIFGIYLAFYGNLRTAMICLIIAGICDLFDGVLARRCKRSDKEKQFGVQIDSLVDVVSFLAFPAVLCFINTDGITGICLLIAIIYVICGIIRLAWFNINADANQPAAFYTGLPVTYAALALPIVYLIVSLLSLPFLIFYAAYILLAVLFIAPVKIPKPRGVWYALFPLLAAAVIIALTVIK